MLTPKELAQCTKARKAGIVNPIIAMQEAKLAALPYALLLSVLDQETGGGHNEWGHDPTIFVGGYDAKHNRHYPEQPVTEEAYKAYLVQRRSDGSGGMQGVGSMQLTWYAFQDRADKLGGCWKPQCNIRVGATDLAANIRRYGMHAGIAAYNGTGPNADRYAVEVLTRWKVWAWRVGG